MSRHSRAASPTRPAHFYWPTVDEVAKELTKAHRAAKPTRYTPALLQVHPNWWQLEFGVDEPSSPDDEKQGGWASYLVSPVLDGSEAKDYAIHLLNLVAEAVKAQDENEPASADVVVIEVDDDDGDLVDDGPAEEDITTEDHKKWYQSGKLYFTGDEDGLAKKMAKDGFWPNPNVWFISDHGNAHQIIIADE